MEAMALEVLRKTDNQPKDDLLYGINDRGIYYWNECIKLFQENKKLNLPAALLAKNEKLEAYCKARVKMYKTLYDQVQATGKVEETLELTYEIKDVNALLQELKSDH